MTRNNVDHLLLLVSVPFVVANAPFTSIVTEKDLDVLDPPDVEQTQFGPDMKRWLSNIVDIINANFTTIENDITALNNAMSFLIEAKGVDIGGSGAGPITVNVIGLTANGFVNVTLVSTTNPGITIVSVVPGLNSFAITFSSDPGASAIIVYQAYIAPPQI